jgi:hypothetical protein
MIACKLVETVKQRGLASSQRQPQSPPPPCSPQTHRAALFNLVANSVCQTTTQTESITFVAYNIQIWYRYHVRRF